MWTYASYDELYHHGVQGQKWGIRRYQNKDGSLTSAGKKRRDSDESSSDKSKETTTKTKPKKISDMSDDEVKAYINRKLLEKQAYQVDRDIAVLNPKPMTTGQKLMNTVVKDTVMPAVKNAGKAYIEKMLKDKLGVNTKDAMDTLAEAAKRAGYEKTIAESETAKRKNEQERKNLEKREKEAADAADAAKKADQEAKKAEREAKTEASRQKAEEARKAAEEAKTAAAEARAERKAARKAERESSYEDAEYEEIHTGTVYGEGTSTSKFAGSETKDKSSPTSDYVDVDFYEVSVNDIPQNNISIGMRYIAGLLEEPK